MEYRITPGRLEIGKFSLYYERVGAGAPIVFLHGLGGNHLSWWQQVPYFMRSFECVTLDQRSFGLSPDPRRPVQSRARERPRRPARPSEDRHRGVGRAIDGRMDDRRLRTRASRTRRRDGNGGYPGGIFSPDAHEIRAAMPGNRCWWMRPRRSDRCLPMHVQTISFADWSSRFFTMKSAFTARASSCRRGRADIWPAPRPRCGQRTAHDADSVPGRRGGYLDQACDREGTRVGAARRADANGPRMRAFDLLRESRRFQSTGARFHARNRLRALSYREAGAMKRKSAKFVE